MSPLYTDLGRPRSVTRPNALLYICHAFFLKYFFVIQMSLKFILEGPKVFNSLAPGRCSCNSKLVILKFISRIKIMNISCEIAFESMPQDFGDD